MRQLGAVLLRHDALQVREDLSDHLGLLDARKDPELAAAVRTALDLDTEHALQAACPVLRHMAGRHGPGRSRGLLLR
jgi:hypothetical protein